MVDVMSASYITLPLVFSMYYIIISMHSPGNVNRLDPVYNVPEDPPSHLIPKFKNGMGLRMGNGYLYSAFCSFICPWMRSDDAQICIENVCETCLRGKDVFSSCQLVLGSQCVKKL